MFTTTCAPQRTISLTDLQRELAGDTVILLDALSPDEFSGAHIPGAINVPFWKARRAATRTASEATPIVVYGRNVACDAAPKLACKLSKLGYTNVRMYRGGKQEWLRFGLDAE